MFFPTCGKVVVVDDQIDEARPLIQILSEKGVPTLYYSGMVEEMPSTPLIGIRLVFCDLKFSSASGDRNITSNLVGILRKLISPKNGPYILLLWSAHEKEYIDSVREALALEAICPEFVLPLNKSDYFQADDSYDLSMKNIDDFLGTLELDIDNDVIIEAIGNNFGKYERSGQKPIDNAIDLISEKLAIELKNVGLFKLFVLWENTIGDSTLETVNSLYNEIPEAVPKDKKLDAMIFYLSRARLERRFDEAIPELKFWSAMDSINELFFYFYTENVHLKLQSEVAEISAVEEIRGISCARFNKWKMFSNATSDRRPGNVFVDDAKKFEFFAFINPESAKNSEGYKKVLHEILSNENIQCILVDLSSECDIAQNKMFASRVVPGIIIPEQDYEEYKRKKMLKSEKSKPEYIFFSPKVEINDKVFYIIINTNQLFYISTDELYKKDKKFTFSEPFVLDLKQTAARNISKYGLETFK